MARVVVIGGGFGGLARPAGQARPRRHPGRAVGHPRRALAAVVDGEFTWDAGPTYTLLPAVVRDLFRKSGRPLERELDLVPLDYVREHRFEDGTSVRLAPGRAAQIAAFDALGAGLGQHWVDHVASYADDWEVLRHGYLENPWQPDDLPRELADRLHSRETLARRLRKTFKDDRLRLVAGHPFVAEGHDLRNVPAWVGLTAYVEQRWGAWTVEGGMARDRGGAGGAAGDAEGDELTGTVVPDVVVREGRVVAVDDDRPVSWTPTSWCVRWTRARLPALAAYVRDDAGDPAGGRARGARHERRTSRTELVLHGDPMLVVRTGRAPTGDAVTVHGRGRLAEDILSALARHRIDLRPRVVARVDRSPRDLVERWGGSPMAVLWQGRATVRRRLGPRTPVPGVYAAGAHAVPGAGLPVRRPVGHAGGASRRSAPA